MGINFDSAYEQQLIDYIHDLQDRIDTLTEENTRLTKMVDSYQLWQRRAINRLKAL